MTVRVGRRRVAARARTLDARRERALSRAVRLAAEAKYGWEDGLVVELDPRRRRRLVD